jgi:hypothetical protein
MVASDIFNNYEENKHIHLNNLGYRKTTNISYHFIVVLIIIDFTITTEK